MMKRNLFLCLFTMVLTDQSMLTITRKCGILNWRR